MAPSKQTCSSTDGLSDWQLRYFSGTASSSQLLNFSTSQLQKRNEATARPLGALVEEQQSRKFPLDWFWDIGLQVVLLSRLEYVLYSQVPKPDAAFLFVIPYSTYRASLFLCIRWLCSTLHHHVETAYSKAY